MALISKEQLSLALQSIKILLSGKLDASNLAAAIESALAQAKASGEFNGPQGPQGPRGAQGPAGSDGRTPVKGVDYWTTADKNEIKAYVDESILGGAW